MFCITCLFRVLSLFPTIIIVIIIFYLISIIKLFISQPVGFTFF